jgi:hypothetical protein
MDKQTSHAQIMWMFKYTYRHQWAPDSIFAGKSRLWVQAFNDLVQKGFIVRRKKYPGYEYKWVGAFPPGF